MTEWFIDKSLLASVDNKGRSPLHIAIEEKSPEAIIQILVKKEFNQYWSTERFVHPYVEPCLERWWWRAVEVSDIPMKQIIYGELDLALPEDLGAIPAVVGSGAGGDYINQIQNTFTREETSFKGISGFTTLDYSDFPGWTFNGLWLGVLGIVSPIGGSGYGTSGPQDMGIIPKKIRITIEADTPYGTGYSIQWSIVGNSKFPYCLSKLNFSDEINHFSFSKINLTL